MKILRYQTYFLHFVWTRRYVISLWCVLCLLLALVIISSSSYTDLLPLGKPPADQPSVMCSFGEGNLCIFISIVIFCLIIRYLAQQVPSEYS